MSYKSDHAEKLKHPKWQRKRLEVMERDGFICRDCGDSDKTLNVHHLFYVKNREVWDYPLFSLKTLCKDCHSDAHPELGENETSGQNVWENGVDLILGNSGDNIHHDSLWQFGCELGLLRKENGMSISDSLDMVSQFLKNKRMEIVFQEQREEYEKEKLKGA